MDLLCGDLKKDGGKTMNSGVIQSLLNMFAGGEDGQKMVKGAPESYVMNSGNVVTRTPMVKSLTDFNMNDPESVKELQTRLGVTADGMFGPETEKAYRMAVDQERKNNDMESLMYDYNDDVMASKAQPFGGIFRNAYQNLDKSVFGGKLPGGYDSKNIMTAEDMYKK